MTSIWNGPPMSRLPPDRPKPCAPRRRSALDPQSLPPFRSNSASNWNRARARRRCWWWIGLSGFPRRTSLLRETTELIAAVDTRHSFMRVVAAVLVWTWAAWAQTPAFEVASVRRSQGDSVRRNPLAEAVQVTPDGVTIRGASLKTAIRWAYKVFEYQVTGPDWTGQERYDFIAKAAGPVPEDQLRRMMQALLSDRLKVAVHRETKDLQAFVLSVGKNGPKFKESMDEGEAKVQPDPLRFTVTIQRMGATQVVEILSNVLRAPVVDNTGLKGKYDVTVSLQKYIPEPGANSSTFDMVSTMVTAFQEELGLKLESKKIPLELVVVDQAERVPTEN